MKQFLTKKNILIGLAVVVAIPVVLGVGVKAYDELDSYLYQQAKRPAMELGKDQESLTKNVHSALKEKNRDNAYALHCMDGGNEWRSRRWKDRTFNDFWEEVKSEDYSESTAKIENDDRGNPTILVENIKDSDGKTFSTVFYTSTFPIDEQYYNCVSFIPKES